MSIIKMIKDRITHFEYQQQQLDNEKEELIKRIERICAQIKNYQDDIDDMQASIEKLERP